MILSENSQAPGGAPWAELKSHKHKMCTDCQQNRNLMPFHIPPPVPNHDQDLLSLRPLPSFSIKRCANPVPNWASFIKHSSPKWREQINTCETPFLPQKHKHCSRNTGFFGKLNKVIFPPHPKTHSFRDIFLEQVLCSAADDVEGHALALHLVDMCAHSFGRNAHTRNSSLHDVMKGLAPIFFFFLTFRNLHKPGRSVLLLLLTA